MSGGRCDPIRHDICIYHQTGAQIKLQLNNIYVYIKCLLRPPPGDGVFELCGERQLPDADRLRDSSNQCESLPATVSLSASTMSLAASE